MPLSLFNSHSCLSPLSTPIHASLPLQLPSMPLSHISIDTLNMYSTRSHCRSDLSLNMLLGSLESPHINLKRLVMFPQSPPASRPPIPASRPHFCPPPPPASRPPLPPPPPPCFPSPPLLPIPPPHPCFPSPPPSCFSSAHPCRAAHHNQLSRPIPEFLCQSVLQIM
ncbi:unnamed protein product [Closterium sp. NIES-65]|nr:unnamed protein product [Closterium sp. NIES-65]